MSSWNKTKGILKQTNPLIWLVAESVEQSSKAMQNASNKDLQALRLEAEKQKIQMQFARDQAKVEQELAIARRIDSALEVEIEEFYDNSVNGKAGLSADAKSETISLGASGEGRKVTKRVYRFKSSVNEEIVTQEPV
ncbi:hypothetical protein ACUMO5_004634 [Vibrio parahaemolyticus]|nr:hypothetical protein [Vibrio parahaemolyticus]EIC2576080.1 hypothetical protein [Vibrio parahaemolyticus]EID0039551.1 hypothetical protein [Vibrio parahaemolyticus]MBM4914719.1 hypothetical protein [Vibrio parahaemolyticus]